jgi:O-antigen/teichoic acid export membrane protein
MKFSLFFISNIFYALCQWLVLLISNKIHSSDEVASFFLVLSISAPIYLFLSFKLSSLFVTTADKTLDYKEYFQLRFFLTLLSFIISFIMILAISAINEKFNFLIITQISISVLTYKTVEFLDDFYITKKIKDLDFYSAGKIKVVRSSFFLLCFLSISLVGGGFALSYFIPSIAYLIYFIVCRCNFGQFNVTNLLKCKGVLIIGLPLGISVSLASISSNVNKYVSFSLLSIDEVVIFNNLLYFVVILTLFINALGQYFQPKFRRFVIDKDFHSLKITYFRCQISILLIGSLLSLFSVMVAEPLLEILFNESFSKFYWGLALIFLATSIKGCVAITGTILNAKNIYNFQLPITIAVTAITIVLSYFMMLKFGLAGGFYTLLLNSLIEVCFYYFYFRFIKNVKIFQET